VSDDFYEDDEDLDDVLDAYRRGDPGVTEGSRILTGTAMETIHLAEQRWRAAPPTKPMIVELRRRTPDEQLDWLIAQMARWGFELLPWQQVAARVILQRVVVDTAAMDGSRLNSAADALDQLADEVDEFTTTASEKAAEVAQKVRDVGAELRSMAEAAGPDETEPEAEPDA
jgi:hypothetical protein